jgi:septal ring-binding cell division protein DamX
MSKSKKYLIAEVIVVLAIIGLVVSIFFIDLDLGIFKVVSKDTLLSQYKSIKDLDTNLLNAKTNYDNSIKSVENSKTDFTKQKEQYEAITDDTISIINEATTDEKYNIEYMWIKLGNYAKSNNLSLALVEPGGSTQTATPASTDTATPTVPTTDKTTTSGGIATTPGGTTTAPTGTTDTSSGAASDELTISVVGNYTDVSSFIFELENDQELRFKLDKIKMEYAGSNEITASFAVKALKFIK